MAVSGSTSRRRGQKECKEKTVREQKRYRQASEFLRYKRRHRFGDLGDAFAARADTVAAGTVRAGGGSSVRNSARTRSDQQPPPRRGSSWRRAWLRSRIEEPPPVLQPEELRLIAHAFAVATSTAPFRAGTPAPVDAEAGDDAAAAAAVQEGTSRPPSALVTSMRALQSVMHALGVWMDDAALQRALRSAELAQALDATGLTLQGVCDVVAEVKKTLHDPKERDADVLEAYAGLGGNTKNLSEGGISASQLHAFTKAAGFPPFNEKAKIVNHLGDVEEGENDEDEAALSAAVAAPLQGADTPVSPSHLIETLVPAEGGVRRFRVVVLAAIATFRLLRSLTPWFLQAKPASPRAQQALTRPKLRTEFFPAPRWTGRRHGYFFTRGLLGLGYYLVRSELPSFHDAQAAARNYVSSKAAPLHPDEPTLPNDYPNDPDEVPAVRLLRYRTALGKQLLQDTIHTYLAEAAAKAAATPPPDPASSSSSSSSDSAGEGVDDAATAGHAFDTATAAAAEAEEEGPHVLRLTANSGPHTFAPSVPDGEAARTAFHVESGIFGEERLRCATGPPRLNQKQPVGYPPAAIVLLSAVCAAVDKPSSPTTPAPAAAEAADTPSPSPRHGKVKGFAPLTEHAVFKDFQQARLDMVGVPTQEASNAWLGAAHVSKASRTGWRPMSGLEEGRESGKRLSTLMREVVFQVIGDTKATKMEAMWKRQRLEEVDCGWLAWKQGLEELEFEGSEVVSRTYTDRADELLDQYDPAWAEEWEAPTDPEMGHRLGRFAGDLGLRTEVEEVQVQQDGYEQLSELSDLQTETEHIISFEVFAAFFDRFRVYKSHRHVGQFTLERKQRRPKVQKSFRATLHEKILTETAAQASPRAAFRRTASARRRSTAAGRRNTAASCVGAADAPTAPEEGLPVTPGPPLLVTAHGSVVEPWRRLRYRHTPRRERGSSTLLKGCGRFMPFDWAAAQADVGRLGSGQRGFDTSQTTFVRVALQAYRFGDRGFAEEAEGESSPSPLFASPSAQEGGKVAGEAEKVKEEVEEEEEEPATTAEAAAALPEHPSWAEAEEAVARLQRTVRRQDEETGAAQHLRNALFVEYAEAVGGGAGDEKQRAQKKGAQAPVPPDLLAEVAALNAAVRERLEAEACKERPTLPTYHRSMAFAPSPAEGTAAAAAEAAEAAATAAQLVVSPQKRHLSTLSFASSADFSASTYVDDEADLEEREFDNGATEVGIVLRDREHGSSSGPSTAEVAEKLAMLQRMRPRRGTQSSVTSLPAASRSIVRSRRGGGTALCAPPPGSPRRRSASPRGATVARRTRTAAQGERERQRAAVVAAKRARIKQRAAEAAAAAGEPPASPRRSSCAAPQLVVSAAAHRIAVEGVKGKSVPQGEADIFYRRRPLPPREKRPEGREPDCSGGGGGLLVGVDVDVEIDAAALRREEHSAVTVSPCVDVCTPVPPASAPPAPFSRRGFFASPAASSPAPRAEPSPEAAAAAAAAAANYRVHLPTASDARRRAEDGFAQHLQRTYLTPSPSSQKTQKARRAVVRRPTTPYW